MKEKIKKIIKRIKGDWFEEERNLITDGYIDSFELIKLITELESDFFVSIPLERIEPECFNSIEDIEDMLKSLEKQ